MRVPVVFNIVQEAYRAHDHSRRGQVCTRTRTRRKKPVATSPACVSVRRADQVTRLSFKHTHHILTVACVNRRAKERPWRRWQGTRQRYRVVTVGNRNVCRSMQGKFGKSSPNTYFTKDGYNVFISLNPTIMCFDKEIFLGAGVQIGLA